MDTSRRAVESYWRSRMIDAATSDEDKVAPVYKLEEICELLRSSHVSIVKEVSDFILKRLDHKSPIVKQKALRLIKYGVGKSGVEFRREMQRHSVAVRQLLHYKGQPDPLKGDALNKSVRETAQEAISAIFAGEESKPAPSEDLNRRIEGFGNTNYEISSSSSSSSDDRKSFFSEVVGIGSASIKQGLSQIAAAHSLKKNDNGSYRSPNLRRSLTTERDHDRYRSAESQNESRSSLNPAISTNSAAGTWGQETRVNMSETANGVSGSGYSGSKTREERLLETIVTSGGVRLQPTRDALQVFLAEALKLDAVALSHALESKLQSHLWQVRMKAVCVLESIIRKKDDEHFEIVASYFAENRDSVVQCSESPQASLREKATKVLNILDGDHTAGLRNYSENDSHVKVGTAAVQMPDLLDTSGPDDFYGNEDFTQTQNDNLAHTVSATAPVTDLFGDSLITGLSTTEQKDEDDPFADVSFHTNEGKEQTDDLFSGLTIDNKDNTKDSSDIFTSTYNSRPELVDIFSSSSESYLHEPTVGKDMNDLMAGLSVNGSAPEMKQQGNTFPDLKTQQNQPISNDVLNGMFGSQMNVNPNASFPLGTMPYNMPPNMMFNPAFASQQMNYGVMGSFLAQQQLLATMSNFQQLGNFNALAGNANLGHLPGNSQEGGYSSPLPDIFNPALPAQNHSAILNNPKKEDTKAFDFISDHLSAARDPKRVV
ncbi:protein MODIFIED TRANSPORT TO THE VACUOLE 1-like [Papaver somniferum]|uniref:protein MODIFIED TRANSPORT TO THE VACUOLE 1-like n=1 Tax=Papaver somniferum TaxID=3469 RepID=UPI000E702E23|nr:protein MODIFIED TRANSPORT TO THE VACUOLE 1-like [Papaver somniferum]